MQLNALLDYIRKERNNLSPLQKKVADYVLENYQQIPFSSITSLSNEIGVSHYTVIKFCKYFGFDKFSEFKKMLSQYASEFIIYNRLSEDSSSLTEPCSQSSNPFEMALVDNLNAVRATLTNAENRSQLPAFLNMIEEAHSIYLTGGRASGHLANIFASFLRYLGLRVHILQSNNGDYWDRLDMIDKEDLVIAISFPRYTAHVVSGLSTLHEVGVPIVLITDNGMSPAQRFAALTFRCEIASTSYVQCYTGCLSLIECLCRCIAENRKQKAAEHLQRLESQFAEQNIFL